jgi:hypothetical protein
MIGSESALQLSVSLAPGEYCIVNLFNALGSGVASWLQNSDNSAYIVSRSHD